MIFSNAFNIRNVHNHRRSCWTRPFGFRLAHRSCTIWCASLYRYFLSINRFWRSHFPPHCCVLRTGHRTDWDEEGEAIFFFFEWKRIPIVMNIIVKCKIGNNAFSTVSQRWPMNFTFSMANKIKYFTIECTLASTKNTQQNNRYKSHMVWIESVRARSCNPKFQRVINCRIDNYLCRRWWFFNVQWLSALMWLSIA